MADDHPQTVFVAENTQVADAVLQLLERKGIAAEAFVPPMEAASEPLTGASEMVWRRNEIEIRVKDAADVTAAKELLNSAMAAATFKAIRDKRANRSGTVTAVCEECGKSSEWPAAMMGTTETCPHCTAYMDIPDPDENWDGVDFGEAEGEGEVEEGEESEK